MLAGVRTRYQIQENSEEVCICRKEVVVGSRKLGDLRLSFGICGAQTPNFRQRHPVSHVVDAQVICKRLRLHLRLKTRLTFFLA